MSTDKVIVALDKTPWGDIERLTSALKGQPCWMKVGMELFYAHGPKAVEYISAQGFPVFLDLKLHDIPTTVHNWVLTLGELRIDMMNVHASGGPDRLEKSFEALEKSGRHDVKLIAVTMLTSTTEEMMQNSLGIAAPLSQTVLSYATMTKNAGLHGVVCSPLESELLKQHLGKSFLCVTPGIRPVGVACDDQKRLSTPKQALKHGSDFLVVGRAITGSADPRLALTTLFEGN